VGLFTEGARRNVGCWIVAAIDVSSLPGSPDSAAYQSRSKGRNLETRIRSRGWPTPRRLASQS